MKIQEKNCGTSPLAPPLNPPMIISYFRATRKRGNHSPLGSLFRPSPYHAIPLSPIGPFPYPPIPLSPLSPHSPISPSPKTLNNNALIYLFCYSDRWSKIFPSSKTGRKAQIQHKHKLRSINPSIPRSWPLVSKPFDQRTRHNLTLFICPNE